MRYAPLLLWVAFSTVIAGTVRIDEPRQDQILYGPTTIEVEVAPEREITEVRFYLDRYPQPICAVTAPPFTCEFDAGTSFQGRTIRVRALDAAGNPAGQHAVATLAFPEPERVVQATLTVPVVVNSEKDPLRLPAAAWSCNYGESTCSIARARKLFDDDGPRVSLDVLVDVSPSVHANRAELEEALHFVLDNTGSGAEIALAEFAGVYHRLAPFTSDRAVLHESLSSMAESVPYTCLVDSIGMSLANLQSRPGHRVLFVISDGEEYCQPVRSFATPQGSRGAAAGDADPSQKKGVSDRDSLRRRGGGGGHVPRVSKSSLAETLETSRVAGIPIYIYRVGDADDRGTAGVFERLAVESGARVFSRAGFEALGASLEQLVEDLRATWLVEVDLPDGTATGEDRRLALELPETDAELRYQRVWRGGNRDSVLAAMLEHGDDAARYWAASQLINSTNRELLDPLIETFNREGVATNRVMQVSALFNMTASLLLHGDVEDQKAALTVIEQLHEIHPVLIGRLRPALEAYLKTEPPRKLFKRARRAYRSAPDRSAPASKT